jgi:D-alanyl-D-alanine carboxypeptidase
MRALVAGLVLSLAAPCVAASARSPAPEAAATDPKIAAAVDSAANAALATGRVPAVAVAVARGGRIVFERAYGYADTARKIPATVDTRFEIGSVTKQITAACVLQLAREKKLSLDDRLARYLSDYFVGRGVTIRQLLEQVSGIPEYLEGDDLPGAAAKPVSFAGLLARVSAKPLDFAPGSRWKYSNTNYAILGRIVALVSREPYETYVREHVFAPAGMTQSGFIDDEATLPEVARGYVSGVKGNVPAPPLQADWAGAAGAVVSTVGDVVKWNAALADGTILPAGDVATMRTSATVADGAQTNYGFGFVVDSLDGHARVWHNGQTFGFYALDAVFPDDDESIVVLSNSALPSADAIERDAFAASHPDVAAASAVTTPAPGDDSAITSRARATFVTFQTNDIDRTRFTDAMSRALTPDKLAALSDQLRPLGPPPPFVFRGNVRSGALTTFTYRVTYPTIALSIVMTLDADGKIAGFVIRPA